MLPMSCEEWSSQVDSPVGLYEPKGAVYKRKIYLVDSFVSPNKNVDGLIFDADNLEYSYINLPSYQ